MHCRQEKRNGGELVTQIFVSLGYLNFSISVLSSSSIASNMKTVLAKEYQVNSSINHRIVI